MQSPCPVCGGRTPRASAVALRYGSVGRCVDCGSGLLEPRPTAAALAGLHGNDDYFDHPYFEDRRRNAPSIQNTLEDKLARIERIAGPLQGKSLVDVGCDVGMLVEHAGRTRGMSAIGIDIFDRVVQMGCEAGRNLRAGTLESVALPADSVDVITAFDLIEHVDDPTSFLREACRVLRPGGVLALETPDYGGLVYAIGRLLGRFRPLSRALAPLQERLWPPFHVQYFTGQSLSNILRRVGLEPLKIEKRELSGTELAVANPLLRLFILAIFLIARGTGRESLLFAVARKP